MRHGLQLFLRIGVATALAATGCPSQKASAPSLSAVATAIKGAEPIECKLVVPSPSYPDNPTTPPQKVFGEGYVFTEDWFTRNIPVWQEHLGAYRGRPNLRYLEVGTFEAMSAIWMLKNVLTADDAIAEGVDPYFDDAVRGRAEKNLEHSGQAQRFRLHQGLSADILPRLQPASYDIVYIDGSHTADDVLADAVLAWLLTKPGGLIVFDDWQFDKTLPEELRPAVAIDAFITAYRRRLDLIHRGYQVIVKKASPGGCGSQPFCTQIGKSAYDFQLHRLYDPEGQPVALSDSENTLVEGFLTSRRFGAARSELYAEDLEQLRTPQLERLAPKLGLELP